MKAVVLTALAAIACTPVLAQPCAPRDAAAEELANRHGEQPIARGMVPVVVGVGSDGQPLYRDSVIEVFASKEGKTWTIIVTDPSMRACQYGHGTDWNELNPEYGVEG